MSFAADWYISSTGNDTDGDGSMALPWASFSKAQSMAAASDVIHVSGMIDMCSDPANTTFTAITGGFSTTNKTGITITKSLTIQGTSSSTDGFNGTSGANTTRFFTLSAAYTLTLKNLKLANGAIVSTLTTLAYGGGAILMTNGNIMAENVVFDNNAVSGHTGITGAAIAVNGTSNAGTYFKNCIFSNNKADKAGAFYVQTWAAGTTIVPSIIQFENCSFVGNEAKNTGGSAIFIRSASEYTTFNAINCTFSRNKVVTASNGGTINVGAKAMRYTNVNIINCTVTENTTAGSTGNGAGLNYVNTANNNIGNLYIKNTIIENNTTTAGAYSDLNLSATSPTVPETGLSGTPPAGVSGYIKIENSFIGAHISDNTRIPAGNIVLSQVGYLTATSTTNALKAGLAPFNAATNSFSLYIGSAAIGYGNSALLTTVLPANTDQLGNVRTANNAGSIETTPLVTTTPSAPTSLVATAAVIGQISVAFKTAATGGSNVTNYKYSTDGGVNYTACSPEKITSPIVITGLSNTAYTVMLKAVNANGDGVASVESNSVTPVTAPVAPTALVATGGNTQISVTFTEGASGGSPITNYKYSTDGGATFTACDPAQTTGPIVITGLTNGTAYSVIIKAISANGDGIASAPSNSVTPSPSTGFDNEISSSISIVKNSHNQIVIKNISSKSGKVIICNALGQRIVSTYLNGASTTIDKTLSSGVYMILVNIEGKSSSTKVIL
jgi:predicted RNA-binding protein with TRAM domain